MQYISTRGNDGPLGFEDALLSGLARDGGLYLPTLSMDLFQSQQLYLLEHLAAIYIQDIPKAKVFYLFARYHTYPCL